MLKKEYKEDLTLEEAMQLEARILFKTMDINELSSDRMEFSVLYRYGLIGCVLNIELKTVKLSNMYFQKKKHKLCSIEFLRICFARSNF